MAENLENELNFPNFEIQEETCRYPNLRESDLEEILSSKHSEKTKKTTNLSVATFKDWCRHKRIITQLEKMNNGQLDQNLRRFYAEARSKKGEMYGRSTLLGFRYSIERYLNQPPISRNVKLSTDPRFSRSNQMLDTQLVNIRKSGKSDAKHKPVIEQEDLYKLKTSTAMSLHSPDALLRNVWFHIVLYFCRRGREGQRKLEKNSFKFEVDGGSRRYVTMSHDELTKNHQGGLRDNALSAEKYARMYETDAVNDGYKALQLYIAKLNPNNDAFFQYPRKNWQPGDDVWFEARPIGVNKLDDMMKTISKLAGLSKIYTNHSFRATAITLWSNAGVPNRHIMAISGHRNEQSLAHYNTQPSTDQLYNCSQVLSKNLGSSNALALQSATITTAQANEIVPQGTISVAANPLQSIFSNCTVENIFVVNGVNTGQDHATVSPFTR